jgi:indolepyruvate ferredoxin oxidoreductase
MAAHLEGKGATVLDFTGFAQKGGAVISHIRIGKSPAALNQVRIADGRADALVACDVVVGTDPRAIRVVAAGRTRLLVNYSEVPSGQFVQDRNADIRMDERLGALSAAVGSENIETIAANSLMERLMGHTVYSNVFLLGHAWQQGLVPVGLAALMRAIEINGVNIEENQRAFGWGRLAAVDRQYVLDAAGARERPEAVLSLDELIEHRAGLLVAFQDEAYAHQYRQFVAGVKAADLELPGGQLSLTRSVARHLYKLMAYKDEYEVARLYTDGEFREKLAQNFSGEYRLQFHMAPPVFNRGMDELGRPRKTSFGPWMLAALRLLAKGKVLRGTALDPFGRLPERREERALVDDYKALVTELMRGLNAGNYAIAVECAGLPDQVRGYGPVKSASIAQYREFRQALLHRFHNPASVVQVHDAQPANA